MLPKAGTCRSGQWIWYRSITSVCRRRRLASHEATMSAAVMPLPSRTQGIPRDGPATLVATVSFCRAPGFLANQLPMMVSVAPKVSLRAGTAYISAVSRKSTPRSSERLRMVWAVASFTCSPKVMVPRQMGVTRKSLWPSWTFCMKDCISLDKPVVPAGSLQFTGVCHFLPAACPALDCGRGCSFL